MHDGLVRDADNNYHDIQINTRQFVSNVCTRLVSDMILIHSNATLSSPTIQRSLLGLLRDQFNFPACSNHDQSGAVNTDQSSIWAAVKHDNSSQEDGMISCFIFRSHEVILLHDGPGWLQI